MKLPTIRSARALSPHRVEVIWSTRRIDRIDVRAALKVMVGFIESLSENDHAGVDR